MSNMRGHVLGVTLEHEDGTEMRLMVGDTVWLKDKPNVRGRIRRISVPVDRAGITRIAIDPEDLDAAAKAGASWPTGKDSSYIETRDSGLSAHKWTNK